MEVEDENKYSKVTDGSLPRRGDAETIAGASDGAEGGFSCVGDEWREKAEVSGSPRRAGLPPATDWQLKLRWL